MSCERLFATIDCEPSPADRSQRCLRVYEYLKGGSVFCFFVLPHLTKRSEWQGGYSFKDNEYFGLEPAR